MTDIGAPLADAIDAAGWRAAPAGDPASAEAMLALLRPLYRAGRRDLPLARLLEGHVDAVQIVRRLGDAGQVAALERAVAGGATLGVWNAGLPGEPLRLVDGMLSGGKGFASGAGVLSHALVTADTPGGTRLLLLDLAATAPSIDRDWWHVTGMQRSETHRVRWDRVPVPAAALVGEPGDYAREPFFSGGALRFVAVHAGGVAGLCDHVRDHLVSRDRAGDPMQMARMAELFVLAQGAANAVRHTADRWFETDDGERLPLVAAARVAVGDAADRALTIVQQAVGVEGHFIAYPLAAHLRDLAVYLRQPAPDAQRATVGQAVAAGSIEPAL